MKFRGHHLFALIVLAVVLLLIWLFGSGRLAVVTVDGSKKCGDDVKKLCCNEKALEAAKMHPDAIKMKCGACDCTKEGMMFHDNLYGGRNPVWLSRLE